MDFSCLLLGLVLIGTIAYWFLTRTFGHWKKQNVPSMPNPSPGFGHMLPVITLKENLSTMASRIYKHAEASMTGFYFMQRPALLVRDPELVKYIMLSNFGNFNRTLMELQEENDPVMTKNPFFVKDPQQWKEARNRISNHLTGKKLRHLHAIIEEVNSKMCVFTDRKIKAEGGSYECEFKNYFTRYTGEIVANAAFGIEGQSFDDNPDHLSFVNVAKTIFDPTIIHGILQACLFYMPSVGKFFRLSFLQKTTDRYFREAVKAIVKQRKQSGSTPNDFLQFCLDSNNEDDIDSIVADVVIFYVDVYETSSTALAVLFYYLSQHVDIQEKLRKHIQAVLERSGGKITYEALKEMTYLEQVLFESMRMMVPLGAITKACTEDITLTGSDGLTCHLKKGDAIFIPVMAMHHDEKYWPDPEKFDPERFSPENQANRSKFVFLPFGEGPRMCIGKRLAIMLIKQAVANLLTKYSIEHSPKMKVPLQMETTSFLTYIKGGFWGKFTKLKVDS